MTIVDRSSHSYMLGAAEYQCDNLKRENERLRAALQKISDLVDSDGDEPLDDAIRIATAALAIS